MNFNFKFSYVLLAGIAVVSVFGMFGFLNANASSVNMSDTMNMNTNSNGNMTGTMNENMTNKTNSNMTGMMHENMTATITPKILPPLQQIKTGVIAQSVQCKEGFSLIFKAEDGSPACVTSQDVQTLVARGWAKTA